MPDDERATTMWRAMLSGEDPSILKVRRFWRRVPAAPRCKVCASPSQGLGGTLARLMWHGPMRDNPLLRKACFGSLSKHPGGAELEISVVFADVRGSTGLAERTSPAVFRRLIQDYYRSAAIAVDENGGIVDKFLGDGSWPCSSRSSPGRTTPGERSRGAGRSSQPSNATASSAKASW